MLPVLSREQMQAFDRAASEVWRVPAAVLMENAGRSAAEAIAAVLPAGARVAVVTGTGNNAGDGFVVARRLLLLGHDVGVTALGAATDLQGDARSNAEAFVALGGEIVDCSQELRASEFEQVLAQAHWVVDAIFGTGLSRPVEGVQAQAIEAINRLRVATGPRPRVVALDIPSGLDANTGRVLGVAVRADLTLCFAHHKLGVHTPQGVDHCGEIRRVDIGVPPWVEPEQCAAWLLEASDVRAQLAARRLSAHKNTAGRVVVFAGSPGKVGAALLVGQAALRSGAGVVILAGFPQTTALLDRRVRELMTAPVDRAHIEDSVASICAGASVVVIGPGLGLHADAQALTQAVVSGFAGPLVVDADALTHFAGRAKELRAARGSLLLTPHPGEMGRLLGTSSADVEADRFAAVGAAVALTGATVLLKGPCTLVSAPAERLCIHRAHAPALATAGAGDVLSGILAAFCLTLPVHAAACTGTFVHARAAEAWQAEHDNADRGLLAHEVSDRVPTVIAGLTQNQTPLPV